MKENLSQIVALLSILVLIFKFYFDWNIKKKEILFHKIKETKINELKEFYKSYSDLELNLRRLQYAAAQHNLDNFNEIKNKLTDLWETYYIKLAFLRLFLEDDELIIFDKVKKELENIYLKLDFYKIEKEFGVISENLKKELIFNRDEIFPKRLPELLNVIETNIRIDFGLRKTKKAIPIFTMFFHEQN